MKFNVFNSEVKTLGLHIGDAALRAFELGGEQKSRHVQAAGELAVAKTVLSGDAILDGKALSGSIVKLLEHPQFGKFTTKNVVVSLPEPKCFVRVIHVQHMSDSELENAVTFEAESYIPVPIDQVYLDWQKLGETEGRMEILLVASPKEYVDKVVSAVEGAGLAIAALEVESESLARIAVEPASTDVTLIVNIQTLRTDLAMAERGNVQFTSTIPIASGIVTDTVARALGIAAKLAENITQEAGIANTPEYPNLKTLMLPVLTNFVSEIKNILAFQAQRSPNKVNRLVLVGPGAQLKHLPEFLSAELAAEQLQVVLLDPLSGIGLPPESFGKSLPPLAYSTAIGLALRPVSS